MNYEANILDQSVFEAFRYGDDSAFFKIYTAFKKPIYITTLKIVGSNEDAEDATVQTFILARERRESIQNLQHLENLIFIIARNVSINILRKRTDQKSLMDEISGKGDNTRFLKVYEDRIFAELVQEIHAAIERLPREMRQVFRLRYIEEKSPKEVADALEMDVQNVYSHTKHAVRELKQVLGKGNPIRPGHS